jgi:molybdopterin molybdotransferase
MDGYAFASKDIVNNQIFPLQIVGYSWAGKPFPGKVTNNQCIRIFTGAVVPEFADSVIAQEQVERSGDEILLPGNARPHENIRAAGSDVHKDEELLSAPKVLSASDLGLLASAGISSVMVKRQLKIGIFSTGDELTALDKALEPGQIYDSNRYMLSGLLENSNHEITDLGVIRDDMQLLEQALLENSNKFDVLISSGGASVGEADFVKQTLEKCGQVNFWKLAIKPGKPLAFGKIGQCWFFGLPGNPVAVLVTYKQFVKPALSWMAGAPETIPLQLQARCEMPLRKSPGRQEYQRGILSQTAPGQYTVTLAGQQDSHQIKVASLANCFIVLDAACGNVEPGTIVTVEPFDVSI